jgi:hypothetical protein
MLETVEATSTISGYAGAALSWAHRHAGDHADRSAVLLKMDVRLVLS